MSIYKFKANNFRYEKFNLFFFHFDWTNITKTKKKNRNRKLNPKCNRKTKKKSMQLLCSLTKQTNTISFGKKETKKKRIALEKL